MKLRRTKGCVLGAIGAVALVAGLVTNVETILSFADRAIAYIWPQPSPDDPIIQAGGPLALPVEALRDDYSFRIRAYEYEKGYRYSLAVHIEAQFRDPVFNSAEFLKGVASLKLIEPTGEDVRASFRDRHALRTTLDWLYLHTRWGPVYRSEPNDRTRSVKWTAYIRHKQEPEESTPYTFQSGPRAWTLTLSHMNWQAYSLEDDSERNWWGAQGSAFVTLDDPDWVVLQSARILKLADDDGSLLETVVHNRSSVAAPLSELTLRAARPKTIFCNTGTSIKPAPRQEVTVNWSRLTSPVANGNTGAVQTSMQDQEVEAKAFYDPEDCSKPVTFEAQVPVEVTVPPGELSRITLKIGETEESADSGPRFYLPDWDTLLVSIAPGDRVSPPNVLVDR